MEREREVEIESVLNDRNVFMSRDRECVSEERHKSLY